MKKLNKDSRPEGKSRLPHTLRSYNPFTYVLTMLRGNIHIPSSDWDAFTTSFFTSILVLIPIVYATLNRTCEIDVRIPKKSALSKHIVINVKKEN